MRGNRIEEVILSAFIAKLGHSTSASEIASWRNSLQYMQNVLLDTLHAGFLLMNEGP